MNLSCLLRMHAKINTINLVLTFHGLSQMAPKKLNIGR